MPDLFSMDFSLSLNAVLITSILFREDLLGHSREDSLKEDFLYILFILNFEKIAECYNYKKIYPKKPEFSKVIKIWPKSLAGKFKKNIDLY